MDNKVWVALGSNLGDSNSILQQAWQQIGKDNKIQLVILSRPYVSEPVGMKSENIFLNAVGILETDHTPEQLLILLQQVEKSFGRVNKTGQEGYQDRLLDLDILYYGESIFKTENLQIPHPHIAKRLFVLAPLAEIDPFHCDPHNGKTASAMELALLQRMTDKKEVFQAIKTETWV